MGGVGENDPPGRRRGGIGDGGRRMGQQVHAHGDLEEFAQIMGRMQQHPVRVGGIYDLPVLLYDRAGPLLPKTVVSQVPLVDLQHSLPELIVSFHDRRPPIA